MRKYLIILFLLFAVNVNAATYNWYFSQSTGNDTTGNGSEATPWKSLAKVQSQENTLASADIGNFYFKRGDTWTFTHTGSPSSLMMFNNCVINVDAYGTGATPIFDGQISFASNPLTGSRQFYNTVFSMGYTGSTLKNVNIKNNHGWGVGIICPAKNVTIQYVTISNVGHAGISSDSNCANYGNLVEYCTVYDAQQLERYGYTTDNYGGGIGFTGVFYNNTAPPYDNTVRYCHVYNVWGEGIWNPNGITEYNVVSNARWSGIHCPAQGWNARTTIIRYNLVYQTAGSPYNRNGAHGIIVADDERSLGNNSAGEFWVYGNILAGCWTGIRMYDFGGYMVTYPYGKVRIFNNTIIDSTSTNFGIEQPASFADVKIYNNTSILYTASTYGHAWDDFSTHANWTISNNHFWAATATDVDTSWRTNMQIGDPKLPKTTGWRSLSNDKDTVLFTNFYPGTGNGLLGLGVTLGAEYSGKTSLMTTGTSFVGALTSSSFVLQDQASHAAYDIGGVVQYVEVVAVAAPVMSPVTCDYQTSIGITMTSATSGASIYYTTNGDTPTSGSTLYSAAVNLTATTTVKAIAIKESQSSSVTTETYTKVSGISELTAPAKPTITKTGS